MKRLHKQLEESGMITRVPQHSRSPVTQTSTKMVECANSKGRVRGCRTGFATNQANSKLTEPRPGKEGTTQASAQHVNCQLFRNLYQQHKSSPRDLSSQQFSPVQRCVCKQSKTKAIAQHKSEMLCQNLAVNSRKCPDRSALQLSSTKKAEQQY